MCREEVKRIIQIIIASYPNYKPANLSDTVDVWSMMLEKYDFKQVTVALKAYIATDCSGFAPSIGQIIEKIHVTDKYNGLNEMEAWALVSRALRNGFYGAEEEFKKLPPLVQKAVGTPGNLRNWALTDVQSVENVIQSNFMRTYRAELGRANEYERMPESVKKIISSTGGMLEGGKEVDSRT